MIGANGRQSALARTMAGFSLIEIMLAMMLGLLVIGMAGGMFYSSQRTYRTTLAVGDVQSNVRLALALLIRDIRAAGGTACDSRNHALSQALAAFAGERFAPWRDTTGHYPAMRGFSHVNPVLAARSSNQVAGTASINILGNGVASSMREHQISRRRFAWVDGSRFDSTGAAIVCAYDGRVQIVDIVHTGAGWSEYAGELPHLFAANSIVSKLHAHTWYVGQHADGGTALYRVATDVDGRGDRQEIVRHVDAMQIMYHRRHDERFQPAEVLRDDEWDTVDAVRIELQVSSPRFATASGQAFARTVAATIALRNRWP